MSLVDVHILDIGPNKLGVVMALKAALGSDLRTAKALAVIPRNLGHLRC